jgi:hypothetical protein
MATKIFEENGVMTLGSIASDQDVQLGNNIHINPPSHDRRCWCCGRPISQLKPFGKAGDPLVGDFDGVYLVKKGRRDGPYDEGATSAVERAEARYSEEGFKDPLDWLIREYGESESPPAERVASGGPPQGGPKLGKVPFSFSLTFEL